MSDAAAAACPGLWAGIRTALRANLLPGIGLWLLGVVVVGAYFAWPAARPVFNQVAAWKAQWGFAFSIIITAGFGGALPWLLARLLGRPMPLSHGLVVVGLCAYRGFEVDAFYRFQGWLFGNHADVATVVAKVVVDELGYSALWAMPTTLVVFAWRDRGCSLRAWREAWRLETILPQLPAVVLCNIMVWTPVITLVYSLPADLQIPLFALAATFWMMVLLVMTGKT